MSFAGWLILMAIALGLAMTPVFAALDDDRRSLPEKVTMPPQKIKNPKVLPQPEPELQAKDVDLNVLVAWLKEAGNGGVDHKGTRRLCRLAAQKLEEVTNERATT